jgi:hypothetical protein
MGAISAADRGAAGAGAAVEFGSDAQAGLDVRRAEEAHDRRQVDQGVPVLQLVPRRAAACEATFASPGEGSVTFTAVGTGAAGYASASDAVTATIDRTAPFLTITSPTSCSLLRGPLMSPRSARSGVSTRRLRHHSACCRRLYAASTTSTSAPPGTTGLVGRLRPFSFVIQKAAPCLAPGDTRCSILLALGATTIVRAVLRSSCCRSRRSRA